MIDKCHLSKWLCICVKFLWLVSEKTSLENWIRTLLSLSMNSCTLNFQNKVTAFASAKHPSKRRTTHASSCKFNKRMFGIPNAAKAAWEKAGQRDNRIWWMRNDKMLAPTRNFSRGLKYCTESWAPKRAAILSNGIVLSTLTPPQTPTVSDSTIRQGFASKPYRVGPIKPRNSPRFAKKGPAKSPSCPNEISAAMLRQQRLQPGSFSFSIDQKDNGLLVFLREVFHTEEVLRYRDPSIKRCH